MGTGLIDLAGNISDLPIPPRVMNSVRDNLCSLLSSYAGGFHGKVDVTEIARSLGVGEENVLLVHGATEAISLISEANIHRVSVIPQPNFWEYRYFSEQKTRVPPILLRTADQSGEVVASEIAETLRSLGNTPACVFLSNPNNPTGVLLDPSYAVHLAHSHPETTFVIDETYLWFNPSYDALTLSTFACSADSNILVVSSLSKFFGIPGGRVGYVIANPAVIDKLADLKNPHSTMPLQLLLAEAVLKEDTFIDMSRIRCQDRVENMLSMVRLAGFEVADSSSNYLFVDGRDVNLNDMFSASGMKVRSGGEFGEKYKDFVRFRVPLDDGDAFTRVEQVFDQLKNLNRV
jgi:threonine-phosphate decarboxylase